jgi:hypothetical protein
VTWKVTKSGTASDRTAENIESQSQNFGTSEKMKMLKEEVDSGYGNRSQGILYQKCLKANRLSCFT